MPRRTFKCMTLTSCMFSLIALLTSAINSHYGLSSWRACLCLNFCEHISRCAYWVALACSKKSNIIIIFLCTHFLNCTIFQNTNISSEAFLSLNLCEHISGCAHGDLCCHLLYANKKLHTFFNIRFALLFFILVMQLHVEIFESQLPLFDTSWSPSVKESVILLMSKEISAYFFFLPSAIPFVFSAKICN